MPLHAAPVAVAAGTILAARFGPRDTPRAIDGLTAFQNDAVARLTRILERYHGAILADSVGLGKTYVARALAADVIGAGGHVLVCGPSHLRQHWKRHMRPLLDWHWVSHTSLSRGVRPPRRAALVVVDEAHAFRNARTRRYAALTALVAGARVLMLTATPVNNSVMDFYHLIRLFAGRDAFAELGVPDLLAAAEGAVHGDTSAVARIADAVVVRRTREALRAWPADAAGARFPLLEGVVTLQYEPTFQPALLRLVQEIGFTAHITTAPRATAPLLMRIGLLKRLESSVSAFEASVRRHIALLSHYCAAAERGLLFVPSRDRDIVCEVDQWSQVPLHEVMLRPWPPAIPIDRMLAQARADIARLQRLRQMMHSDERDAKLARLQSILAEHQGERVVVFTEYRHTGTYLWRVLAASARAALIHGGEARLGNARAARSTVIERFAPASNACRPPPAHQRVDVLIATDVIAEGMNLQDARVVVSYDLPWNPVRVAQRVGRIDRLGSPHDRIFAYAFAPAPAADDIVAIMRRLHRKIRQIRAVGGDAPRFMRNAGARVVPDAAPAEMLRRRYYQLPPAAPPDAPLAAAAAFTCEHSSVLTCWRAGATARFVLSTAGRGRELSLGEADALLLSLLDAPDAAMPPVDIRRTMRQAKAVLRRGHVSASRANVTTRVAGIVRAWLRARPHASDADIATAERILCGVGSLAPADEHAMARLLSDGSKDDVICRAATLIGDGAARTHNAHTIDTKLIALIVLVPRAA